MAKYEVRINGETVWSETTKTYEGVQVFPTEYRGRPVKDTVTLVVDGEVIGVQTPYDPVAEHAALQVDEARKAGAL